MINSLSHLPHKVFDVGRGRKMIISCTKAPLDNEGWGIKRTLLLSTIPHYGTCPVFQEFLMLLPGKVLGWQVIPILKQPLWIKCEPP